MNRSGLAASIHFVDPETHQIILYEGTLAGTGIFYNTESVKPNDFSSYWDLLDPKWKGKIADVRAGRLRISQFDADLLQSTSRAPIF